MNIIKRSIILIAIMVIMSGGIANSQDMVNITTQGRNIPNLLENVCSPNPRDNLNLLLRYAWRFIPTVQAVSNGYIRSNIIYIEGDGINATASYTDTSLESIEIARTNALAIAASNSILQAAAILEIESQLDNATRITKGLGLTILDEINILRNRISSNDAIIAASTSLANFQTRQAALTNLPQRTTEQLKTAVYNKAKELP